MKKSLFKRKIQEPTVNPPSLDSFPDFTKKEIFTQGELISELLNEYVKADKINFDYLKIKADKIKRVYIVAGAEDYACALFGAYNIEVLIDAVAVAVFCGEFMCSNPILDKGTLVVLIGEDKRIEKRVTANSARLVKIANGSDDANAIRLNYKTLGSFQSAEFSLKLTAISLLALYLGEKRQVITALYVKIATQMLFSLPQKIKRILSREFIINELCRSLDFDNMLITGTNVDYGIAYYAARIMSDALHKDIVAVPYCEISACLREKAVVALASNIDFYGFLDEQLDYRLKIVASSVDDTDDNVISYDESIPLLNPILSAVVIQMLAYKKYN